MIPLTDEENKYYEKQKDLCKVNYQNLLITYLEFTIKNANHAWKKKIKSECHFIGFKNNRLNYKCKECGEKCSNLINETV